MRKRVHTQPTDGKYGKKKSSYNKWSLLLLTFSLIAMLVVNSPISIHALEQYKYFFKWGSFGSGNSQLCDLMISLLIQRVMCMSQEGIIIISKNLLIMGLPLETGN